MGKHKFTHTKMERSDIVVIGIYLFRTTLLETFWTRSVDNIVFVLIFLVFQTCPTYKNDMSVP